LKNSFLNERKQLGISKKDKKGGVVTSTVMGVGGLIIGTVVILVVIQTLNNASLLGTGTTEAAAVANLTANFTDGLDEIALQIPTILLIVAVVFLFGALVLLIRSARTMTSDAGGGGGGSL
jgi:ABC-type phosphate transport system permease subunit